MGDGARALAGACSALRRRPRRRTIIRTSTVTLVVPYPPGGGVDVLARVVAEKLSGVLGQQVIVDNRVGGSGLVGTRAVIRSAPDGYTLFLGHTGSISINPSLYANAGFDPRKDFTADRAVRLDAGRAARASVVPGQDHRRGGRARQEGRRQAQHRHLGGRHRRLSLGRAVQVDHRRAGDHRALQGHGATDERSARRPCADRVRRAAAGDGQSRGRHACAASPCSTSSASACCRTFRPRTSPGCRASSRCCTTACSAPAGTAAADRRQAQRRDAARSPSPTR